MCSKISHHSFFIWVSYPLLWVHSPNNVIDFFLSYWVQYGVTFNSGISIVENIQYTVYPKKYAHGFCFAVLCCGYTLTDFPISIRLTSLALWQSNDCPSASKATLMNMDKYFMWIHYERLHNHNKAKHNKTVCIFLGIYCMMECSAINATLLILWIAGRTLMVIRNVVYEYFISQTFYLWTIISVFYWLSLMLGWLCIFVLFPLPLLSY